MPHFNLDFLGGYLIGALITFVTIMWCAWYLTRRDSKQRAATLTLHDSSGFMPDMDVRVSSGDGSHAPDCACRPCFDGRWDRFKRARE